MSSMTEFQKWCESPYVDDITKKELLSLTDNENEINERFYQYLEFGTAGLRGIIGAGSNRMNIYTVRHAAQGLASYILTQDSSLKDRGVVISYDSRHFSKEFALESAKVLAGNNIKVFLFDKLNPVPALSFAVRHLNCIAGIMITASHNPAKYNGFKVYWEDGAQISPLIANKIIEHLNKIDIFEDVKLADESKLITMIGEDVEEAYLKKVYAQKINGNYINDDLKIVYTPLHGSGNIPVRKILNMLGVKNVHIVSEQELPDPDFSTVKSPNPENAEAFDIACSLANKVGATFIIGTDPDCDRMGIMVKNNDSEFIPLTGNQVGALLIDFILSQKVQNSTLPQNPVVVKTIVSTPMADEICKAYNVKIRNVLTGFKYIGEIIKNLEENGEEERYIFGFEESYGYLSGTYARDKDAVVASMLTTQMAAYYQSKGITLYQAMNNLYEKYGYFKECQKSITLEGLDGLKRIKGFMNYLRENPPKELDNNEIISFVDYNKGVNNLPKSDVLEFILKDHRKLIIRPSGTEPKIKFYFFAKGKSTKEAEDMIISLNASIEEITKKSL